MNTNEMTEREKAYVRSFIKQFERETIRKERELGRRFILLEYLKENDGNITSDDCNYIISWLDHSTPSEKSGDQIISDLTGE